MHENINIQKKNDLRFAKPFSTCLENTPISHTKPSQNTRDYQNPRNLYKKNTKSMHATNTVIRHFACAEFRSQAHQPIRFEYI